MPLAAAALSSLVYIDHLSNFPAAATVRRKNDATGVPSHNPAAAFVDALCEGFVTAIKTAVVKDLGIGTDDVPGLAIPVPFVFVGQSAAIADFLVAEDWTGPEAAKAANVLIGSVLSRSSTIGLIQMSENALMGSGAGIISPLSNPTLQAEMAIALKTSLVVAFQTSGKFGTDDVPGAPVNPILAARLVNFADAYATGIASVAATVAYVGTTATTVPVAGIVNTGSFI